MPDGLTVDLKQKHGNLIYRSLSSLDIFEKQNNDQNDWVTSSFQPRKGTQGLNSVYVISKAPLLYFY